MITKYNFFQLVGLLGYFVRTKFLFTKARLIRFPFDVRNIHLISVGKNFTTGKYCRLEAYNYGCVRMQIGNDVQINDSVHIVASQSVIIEDNVLIASKVYISDTNHGIYSGSFKHDIPSSPPALRELNYKSVKICKNVWIGEFVSILPGVTIGEGSIIGTMSVVTKDIPANCIAVGSPAVPIKIYNFGNSQWEKI